MPIEVDARGRQHSVLRQATPLGANVWLHVSGFCRFIESADAEAALLSIAAPFRCVSCDIAGFSDAGPPFHERRVRDQGKCTQGWALVELEDEEAALSAAAGLAGARLGSALGGGTLCVAPARSRVALSAARAAEAAAAAAASAAARERQRVHNQRQRQRRRGRGTEALTSLLAGVSPPGGLDAAAAFQPLDGVAARLRANPLPWASVAAEARPEAALLHRSLLSLPEPASHVSAVAQARRCRRKALQVESFYLLLQPLLALEKQPGTRLLVVDFCCGTGGLALPLAALLPQADFLGVDVDPESMRIMAARAAAAGLRNVRTQCARVEEYAQPAFDVALGLHACGSLTDHVMLQAAAHGALYVVCPCCMGKLAFSLRAPDAAGAIAHPRSAWLRAHLGPDGGAAFAELAAAADVSHGEAEDEALLAQQGVQPAALRLSRAAKLNLELDRQEAAREAGYSTAAFLLLQPHVQAKNAMLLGVPPSHPLSAQWRAVVHTFSEL